jgi:HEAT repeat protein
LIKFLAEQLGNENWQTRREARRSLQAVGKAATPYIISVLHDGNENARWEAAKSLIKIADPSAAPSLVAALEDENYEIQWLAAEALIALGEHSIMPILEALSQHPESPSLRAGAHHVLHDLERQKPLPQSVLDVLNNIRSLGLNEYLIILAKKAITWLKNDVSEISRSGD